MEAKQCVTCEKREAIEDDECDVCYNIRLDYFLYYGGGD